MLIKPGINIIASGINDLKFSSYVREKGIQYKLDTK